MATSAKRSISPSSLRRGAEASTDLAMAPPTLLIASDGKQILSNHTPAHVALKSKLSFIGGSPHGEGMLQGADGGFTAGPPAQRSPEASLMLLEGRHPGRRIGRIARENLVAAYDAVFHLVNAHQPTKLVGLMRFPFANDFGVRFEQTQHLALHVAVAAQHPLLGLADHLFDQGEKVSQLAV